MLPVVILALLCVASPSRSESPIVPTPTLDRLATPVVPENPTPVDLGRQVYYLNCMPCHGDAGQGLTEEWRNVWVEDHRNCWAKGCHGGRLEDEGSPLPRTIPAVMGPEAMQAVVSCAERAGAWIVADEVYRGAELEGPPTPSFWRLTERVVIVNGLSKAYGLPGVRIGWILGPAEFVEKTWPYHDYTTISPSVLSDRLARIALSRGSREKILERTRGILRTNFPILREWLERQRGFFDFLPPAAGAIAFASYQHSVNSTELVTRLIREKNVLIVPGDHFEMDHHLRFGFGSEANYLRSGLARIEELIEESLRQ